MKWGGVDALVAFWLLQQGAIETVMKYEQCVIVSKKC